MAGFARHGVFVGLVEGYSVKNIHLRIVGYHRLIHAIEGQLGAVGRPEQSAPYAELVAMYALSVNDTPASVGRQLGAVAALRLYHELVIFHVCQGFRCFVPRLCLPSSRAVCGHLPFCAVLLPVQEIHSVLRAQQYERLIRIGKGCSIQRMNLVCSICTEPFVNVCECKKHALFARHLIYNAAFFGI